MLKPSSSQSIDQITINGKKLDSKDGVLLKPNDRIIFGTNSVFLFKDPTSSKKATMEDPDDEPIQWENAQKERSDIDDASNKQAQEEMLRKQEGEAKAKIDEVRKQQEQLREQMQKEYEEKLKALTKVTNDAGEKKKLEQEMKKKEEARMKKLEEEEQKIIRKQQEQSDLERRLGVILPMVNEANLISKELKRDFKFNVMICV